MSLLLVLLLVLLMLHGDVLFGGRRSVKVLYFVELLVRAAAAAISALAAISVAIVLISLCAHLTTPAACFSFLSSFFFGFFGLVRVLYHSQM